MGFDFGSIGNVISSFMDTDYIDIKRDVGGKLQEVYSNIPCHVAFASTDNPDPTSVDVRPIIQSITVHCQLWVDLRNDDFLVAKKVGPDGTVEAVYSGRCGNPVVSQGRKKVSMQMNGTEPDAPTPVPPTGGATVTVRCLSGGEDIQALSVREVGAGDPFVMEAPSIAGYNAVGCFVDGEAQEEPVAYIPSVSEGGHTVVFDYAVSEVPSAFRYLVNGFYTSDDGSLASGWHTYKAIPLEAFNDEGGWYRLTCKDEKTVHGDSGKRLSIVLGAKLVLSPSGKFIVVSEILSREGGSVTFKAVDYEPTEAERNYYPCKWYD